MTPVIVLGGYGNFGRRICEALAQEPGVELFVAGRDRSKAAQLAAALGESAHPLPLDHTAPDFADRIRATGAVALVHTSGPFQGQGYTVAAACIEAGCHYIDIADAREHVAGIAALDERARQRNVLVVSGASSVPALSSAVVEQYIQEFSRLDVIRHGISAGAKPPGIATMRAVMSYVGRPFRRWEGGQWRTVHGWQDLCVRRFPGPVGRRWMAACDVPDLDLFQRRYADVRTVTFHAGLGFASTTLMTWALSWLVRSGLSGGLLHWAGPLHRAATMLEPFGTKRSGMHVHLAGTGRDGRAHTRDWYLLAGDNHGPHIPCAASVALVKKLARGELTTCGAMPCLGLVSVDEILNAIPGLDLRVIEDRA
jgi:NAD(P)-dependent dehydrogenase (short-subunit alcohol dehydrogenase family)